VLGSFASNLARLLQIGKKWNGAVASSVHFTEGVCRKKYVHSKEDSEKFLASERKEDRTRGLAG
jgi:hypothetical protein